MTPEEIEAEFCTIISHALLGCDTSDVSKETWQLVFSECAKYSVNFATLNDRAVAEAAWTASETYMEQLRHWSISIRERPKPTAPDKEQYLSSLPHVKDEDYEAQEAQKRAEAVLAFIQESLDGEIIDEKIAKALENYYASI